MKIKQLELMKQMDKQKKQQLIEKKILDSVHSSIIHELQIENTVSDPQDIFFTILNDPLTVKQSGLTVQKLKLTDVKAPADHLKYKPAKNKLSSHISYDARNDQDSKSDAQQ